MLLIEGFILRSSCELHLRRNLGTFKDNNLKMYRGFIFKTPRAKSLRSDVRVCSSESGPFQWSLGSEDQIITSPLEFQLWQTQHQHVPFDFKASVQNTNHIKLSLCSASKPPSSLDDCSSPTVCNRLGRKFNFQLPNP